MGVDIWTVTWVARAAVLIVAATLLIMMNRSYVR